MNEVSIRIEGLETVQKALRNAQTQFPSAVRNIINDTARDVQRDFRATLPGKFDVRKKSAIDRQVYIAPEDKATKDKWSTRIQIRGPGGTVGTLDKFEKDGRKSARSGRIAVPARGIRTGGGHVRSDLAWDKLTPLVQMGGQYTKLRKRKGALIAGKTLTSRAQLVGRRGTFVVTLKRSGQEALVRRAKGQPKGWNKFEILWIMTPSVPIPTSLRFERDAGASARVHLPARAEQAITHALRRAGL